MNVFTGEKEEQVHMTIGEFLQIKETLGVTYDTMAKDLHVSKRILQYYKEGKRPIPFCMAYVLNDYAKNPSKFRKK